MNTMSEECLRLFELQKKNQQRVGSTTAEERKAKIMALKRAVEVDFREAVREACKEDLGRAAAETDLADVAPVIGAANHAVKHVSGWMKERRVGSPMALFGTSSKIIYEPKGVCLIMSPWNYPFNLTLVPLVAAIAGGNVVIVKPSEISARSSAVLREIIGKVFREDEVAVVEGGVDVATSLLELPFNHIFFTGSPAVGRIVMGAAARHLSSVTLELGGKSPTIIDETADVGYAVRMTAWGKFMNNGQTCIAPDYVFVHERVRDAFMAGMERQVKEFYGDDPRASVDYSRIVSEGHFDRVKGYLDDAVRRGARVAIGGESERGGKYISPTVVEGAPLDCELMRNEIFGPVLPVLSYKRIEEVLEYVWANARPLAVYVYSRDKDMVRRILVGTRAGGTCVNSTIMHYLNNELPFGGVNNSGIGKAHGRFGFEAFTNARGVLRQVMPSTVKMLMPPYSGWRRSAIEFAVKRLY